MTDLQRVCTMPKQCQKIVNQYQSRTEENVLTMVQNFERCLSRNQVDEYSRTIQLSLLTNLASLHFQSKSSTKFHKFMSWYCTVFASKIIKNFKKFVRDYPASDIARSHARILPSVVRRIIQNIPLMKSFPEDQLITLCKQLSIVYTYVYQFNNDTYSQYTLQNYSLVDYINEYVEKKIKTSKDHRKLYQRFAGYNYGCNCFCRTVLFGVLFKQLHHMNPFDHQFDISFFTQGGPAIEEEFHIFLGVSLSGNVEDKLGFFYIESTLNPFINIGVQDKMIGEMASYFQYCIAKLECIDTFRKIEAPLDIIILQEYFQRNINSFYFWYQKGRNDLWDRYPNVFNALLIMRPESTDEEIVFRIFQEMRSLPNSGRLWNDYKPFLMQILYNENFVEKIGIQIRRGNPPTFQGKNMLDILNTFPTIFGTNTEELYRFYQDRISKTFELLEKKFGLKGN